MTEDAVLVAVVAAVWAALAALYAFVPMFTMPGSALVWGSGSAVFLVFLILIVLRERESA